MVYRVKLAEEFLEEIAEIYYYISVILQAQHAAKRLIQKINKNLFLLRNSPKLFTKIEKYSKTKRRYRRLLVNNYVILYTIDETEKIVYVAHIYYGGRNYIDNL